MRLTNTIRDAFVRAALDDVPSIDYSTKITNTIFEATLSKMPSEVLAAYKKYPEYFVRHGKHIEGVGYYYGIWGNYEPDTKIIKSCKEMGQKSAEQHKTRRDLETKLKAVAYSVTTRKALVELLPEFEKYLPEEGQSLSRSVPVVIGVKQAFVKAGWPKGSEKKAA